MGNGQHARHRGHGREGRPSSSNSDRVVVLPGDEIPSRGLRPGVGTYRTDGRIYASVLGLVRESPPFIKVMPLSGRYIPHAGDVIVGIVTDVQGTFWLLDIAAPRWAPLHMTGTPWKIDFGETGNYLHVGDSVVVAVEQIDETGRIGVTMNGPELGKLEGGTLFTVSPAKIPRVIGRGGSMIQTITEATGCQLRVGQNGRVWADGPPDGIRRVHETLVMIETEGQRRGLTERVERYLTSSAPTGPELPWTGPPRSATLDEALPRPESLDDGPGDDIELSENGA
ncbi:MAG: exosome complex RNA-binding protein Rrp4 [Thermoplasmata archaeon]|nr:exosome complex RNA-binding protein Rrp4 [Thermoplasmata archaeon]